MYVVIYKSKGRIPASIVNERFYNLKDAETYAKFMKSTFDEVLEYEVVKDIQCKHPERLEIIKKIFDIYRRTRPHKMQEDKFFYNNEFNKLYDMPSYKLVEHQNTLERVNQPA